MNSDRNKIYSNSATASVDLLFAKVQISDALISLLLSIATIVVVNFGRDGHKIGGHTGTLSQEPFFLLTSDTYFFACLSRTK